MSKTIINIIISLIAGFLIGLGVMFMHVDRIAITAAEEYCEKTFEELRYDLIEDTADVLSDDISSEVTCQMSDEISHLEEELTDLIYDELGD